MTIPTVAFERDLRSSGWIHRPLPLHAERSLEAEGRKKVVLNSRELPLDIENWSAFGECTVTEGDGGILITAPLCYHRRPNGDLELGDCSSYGSFGAEYSVSGESWEAFNRMSLTLDVEAKGERKICARLCFRNDGKAKLPDPYFRDGFHAINLQSGKPERICVEIPELPRDRVTGLSVAFYCGGCETEASLGNVLTARVSDVRLEKIAGPEIARGWKPDEEKIIYCFSGYLPEGKKTALILGHVGETFRVVNEAGEAVLEGSLRDTDFHGLSAMDFSVLATPGTYRIESCGLATKPFSIDRKVWLPSAWKVVNFLFCQRCGYPVPGIHQACHRDVVAHHDGKSFVFNGGWHDAGDLSQQLIQSAEVTWALFELADALPADEVDLKVRVEEEALWGLDYVLKSRFGDGYRATSVGTAMWSQGFMGDADDISARLHDNAYENYLCAAVECYCAGYLKTLDPALSATCLQCAKADFDFAEKRFAKTGFSERPPIYWEHSWMTSESAFMATSALAASFLYGETAEERYAASVEQRLDYVLSCQQTEAAGAEFPEGGFFYRNPEHRAIVHFSHQARDQIYAQALSAALAAMPHSKESVRWKLALERHAAYLRSLMEHASPYGMAPAGLYKLEERDDQESFQRQHLQTGEEGYLHYAKQLEEGTDVGGGYTLRQFPVWFSFKGNNAVILSIGKAMAICGRVLSDRGLLQAAEQQLAWNIGMNPFRQSLMYGEGVRYAQQYAAMSGEAVGELPVGIQTLDNEDVPYWPQMNNATYKEVWTTPAGRWMSILAELVAE